MSAGRSISGACAVTVPIILEYVKHSPNPICFSRAMAVTFTSTVSSASPVLPHSLYSPTGESVQRLATGRRTGVRSPVGA